MDSADSALKSALLTLTSPQVLAALLAIIGATLVALVVARALRARRMRDAAADLPLPAHWLDHALEGAVLLAPILAALVTLLAAHAVIAALAVSTAVVDAALRLVARAALLRLGVFVLGLLLGPGSWVRARGARITLFLWAGGRRGHARLARPDRVEPQPHQPGTRRASSACGRCSRAWWSSRPSWWWRA